MYHIAAGFNEPCLREPIVKLILKGQSNLDNLRKRIEGKMGRLPVTVNLMKLIKLELSKVRWSMEEVRLFWAVACLAWGGLFRIHELLSRDEREYDAQTTLLWRDIKMSETKIEGRMVKTISVHVKSPKVERIGNGDNIMVFELGGIHVPSGCYGEIQGNLKMEGGTKSASI